MIERNESAEEVVAAFRTADEPDPAAVTRMWIGVRARLDEPEGDAGPERQGIVRARRSIRIAGAIVLAAAIVVAMVVRFQGELASEWIDGSDPSAAPAMAISDPAGGIASEPAPRHAEQNTSVRPIEEGDAPSVEPPLEPPPTPPSSPREPRRERPTPPPTPPPTNPTESEASSGLTEETRLVRAAKSAIEAGRPAQALSLLKRHAARFPRGALARERATLQVRVLCKLGLEREARRAYVDGVGDDAPPPARLCSDP